MERRMHGHHRRSGFRLLRHLNDRQSRVLIACGVLLALALLIPPWLHEYRTESGDRRIVFAGFRPAFLRPETAVTFNLYRTRVDGWTLAIELLGIAGLAAGSLRAMSD
jgi:hypothetical protein